MNKKSERAALQAQDVEPLLDSPSLVFADQIAQVAVGPFVTRLVFGVERAAGQAAAPVVSVVMPTLAALGMAQGIISLLSQKDVVSSMKVDLENHMTALDGLVASAK